MPKTILVTGSSRGIGRAVARLAHQQGYTVIVHGRTDSEELERVHRELSGSVKTFFDVSDRQAVFSSLSHILKNVGMIDGLVNNAGVASNFLKDISEVDDEKAMAEYRVNYLGTVHCLQTVLPKMVEAGKGSVVNVASIKADSRLTTLSTLTFGGSKAALVSLTKALAKVYSPKGVRFNVVLPGYVETDQVKLWNEETFRRISEGTLLGRIARPEEVAPLIMFLASDEAAYVTGSEFLIDGGYALKGK